MAFLDVERAEVSRSTSGAVTFSDPGYPFVVRIWTRARTRGHPETSRIYVTARPGQAAITARQLARLPLDQMLHIATSESATVREHPNELYYRMLAKPKPPGQRSWPDDHWPAVLEIFEWATDTKRPGGGIRAVAELWRVSRFPTAQRWLAEARRKRAEQQ